MTAPPDTELEVRAVASSTETLTVDGAVDIAERAGAPDGPLDDTLRSAPSIPPGTVLGGRYRLDEGVGSGGGGVVYRALDLESGASVAVKLLRPDRVADARARLRFQREVRAISRLAHPGCLRVLDHGAAAGQIYMVTEFMPGGDLRRLAGEPPARLLPVLVALARSLAYVHGRRIVHRDLKPSNVLLTADDPPQPRLADFGIAAVESEPVEWATTTGHTLRGTVDFMAPEQVRCERADPRTDLYAFGCLIFSLFAGRPPFEGPGYTRLIARLEQPAPPLSDAAAVPPGLDAITARLLQRDPDERYQSALDLAADLAELTGESSAATAPMPPIGAVLFDPGVVGREHELAQICGRVADTPTPLAVIGPAGVGKSGLMRAVVRRLAPSRRVVTVSAAAITDPFAPIPAIERALAIEADAATSDGGRDTEAWTAALARRVEQLAAALTAAAAVRELTLIVEDLHLVGPGGAALFGDLLEALAGRGPTVVLTLRPTGALVLDGLAARVPIDRQHLTPLDGPRTARLVGGMLGLDPDRLPAGLAEWLVRSARGVPLLVRSDVRRLAELEHLRRVRDGWRFDPPDADSDILPAALLRSRLALPSPATRALLGRAAVCGEAFDSALVARAFGLGEAEVLDGLDEALRAGIVQPTALEDRELDRWRFGHSELWAVVYDAIEPERRAQMHRRVADALEADGASPAALAWHRVRGPDRAAACAASLKAAEHALHGYAFASAERHLLDARSRLDALPHAQRRPAQAHAAERLADARMALGRPDEAVELLAELSRADGQPRLDRARRTRKLGLARMRLGDPARGVDDLEDALTLLGDARPTRLRGWLRLVGDTLIALAQPLWRRRGRPDPLLRERALCHRELAISYRWIEGERCAMHAVRMVRLAEALGDVALRVDGRAHLATGLAFLGLPGLAARLERTARSLAVTDRDLFGESWVEVLSGVIDTVARADEPRARAHFERAIELAEAVGDRFLLDFVRTSKGWCVALLSHLDEAVADFDMAGVGADEVGRESVKSDASAGRMLIDITCGRVEQARAIALAARRPEVARSMPALMALADEGLGSIALQAGRYREAIRHFEEARRQYRARHLDRMWGWLVEVQLIEALLLLVDAEGLCAVPDLVPRLRRLSRSTSSRLGALKLFAGVPALLQGVVAARRGRRRAALRAFARAERVRPGPRTGYLDSWMRLRIALERHRLGAAGHDLDAALDAVEAIYRDLGAVGMLPMLDRIRRGPGLDAALSGPETPPDRSPAP